MKVFITPKLSQVKDDNGIGRVIHAQYRYLPQFGIEIVDDYNDADIIAGHVNADGLPRIDVLHCHGLYWTADHGKYNNWHHDANKRIIEATRLSSAVSVPSQWVAEVFKRDFRITPEIIGHGIDVDSIAPFQDDYGYLLWNKNRSEDVCSPLPAWEMSQRGIPVVSTFAPTGKKQTEHFQIIGTLPHDKMIDAVQHASVYLATTQETFGIGTLEALAAGVPVLGYNWGGTADIVRHKVDGYLVEPDDLDGLFLGYTWIKANREQLAKNSRQRASDYSWQNVCKQYAELYERIRATTEIRKKLHSGVSVVISCYNYEQYVGECIQSIAKQTKPPKELIIVNDGSTDNSLTAIQSAVSMVDQSTTKVVILDQRNQGVAAARNNGIKVATQDHIVSLDADDMLAPRYIETLHNAMLADRGLGVAYAGLSMRNADGSEFGKSGFPPEFSWEIQSKGGAPPANCIPSAAMFRRDMWQRCGGYQQIHAPGEDAEFFTRGLSVGFRAKRVTTEHLFLYRLHGQGAHVTRPYKPIDTWLPWIRDKKYPIGAPSKAVPKITSYSRPLVSVIVPVGPNHTHYLRGAIDSVLGQTLRDWELIVVNDSGEPLDLPEYPFAKIIASDKRHPGLSRNLGIEQAKAPFAYFLDADDYIHPTTLEKSLVTFVKSGGSYVYSDWIADDGKNQTPQRAGEYKQDQIAGLLPHAVNALVPTTWLREVGGFDDVAGWEEWSLYAKLAQRGYCGARLPEALLYYRTKTGTVRKRSFENADSLKSYIQERYGEIIMGCCGGSRAGQEILAAKRVFEQAQRAFTPETSKPIGEKATMIRMAYKGQQIGAQIWKSKIQPQNRQRWYRGGRDGVNEFADVHADDVDYMLSTGMWEIVSQPPAQDHSTLQEPVGPVVSTVPTPEVVVPEALTPEAPMFNSAQVAPQAPVLPDFIQARLLNQPILPVEELTGELPPNVEIVKTPEPPKKRQGRPKNRGYSEEVDF